MRPILFGLLILGLLVVLGGVWLALEPSSSAAAPVEADGAALERAQAAALVASDAAAAGARAPASAELDARASEPAQPVAMDAGPERARVTGRVVDAQRRAVAGATVLGSTRYGLELPLDLDAELLPHGWIERVEAVSDSDGRFVLDALEPGPLRIAVRARGFAPRDVSFPALAGAPFDAGDVALDVGVVLAGTVVDARGNGVQGARVYGSLADDGTRGRLSIQGFGVPLAESDAAGRFTVDVLAPGPWRVFVESDAHTVAEASGRTLQPGERVDGLRIVLKDGGEIRGRVEGASPPTGGFEVRARVATDPAPAEASAGRSARAPDAPASTPLDRPRRARTLPDGSFELRGLEPSVAYRLTVWEPGASARGARPTGNRFEPATALAGERGVVLRARPQTQIVLRAVDARTGAPIEELVAWAGIGRERAVCDPDGNPLHHFDGGVVRSADLRPPPTGGALWLRLRAAGYAELSRRDIEVAIGATTDLGALALEPEPALSVRVVEQGGGAPIVGASVLVAEAGPDELASYQEIDFGQELYGAREIVFGRTGAGGVVRLAAGAGRSVDVRALARGHLSAVERIEIPLSGEDAQIELALALGGRVTVRVLDEAGAPVARIGVVRRAPGAPANDDASDEESPEQWTDALGVARFAALSPGTHAFRLQGEGRSWRAATVAEGTDVVLDWAVPARATVSGVVRQTGEPLAGAVLRLARERDADGEHAEDRQAATDRDGRFTFDAVAPGRYALWVGHASRAMALRRAVDVTAPHTSCNVDLPVASIAGRVVDSNDRPLAGVRVRVQVADEPGADSVLAGGLFQTVLVADENGSARVRHRPIGAARAETGADGRYVLRGVVAGATLAVNVERDDLESVTSAEIVLGADEERAGLDFTLRGAGSIEVAVAAPQDASRARGAGVALSLRVLRVGDGAPVEVRAVSWNHWQRRQVLRNLLPGTYDVRLARAASPNEPLAEQRVTVQVGETSKVSFPAP